MEGGAWWAAVHGVTKSRTRLSDFTFPFHFHALEKAVATPSSVPAWRIPGTGEPGGLPFMGSHRVELDWKRLSRSSIKGLPWWLNGKESTCQCRRHGFNPCSGRIPRTPEQLSPFATTTEAPRPRSCAPQQKKPLQSEACTLQLKRSLHLPQLEKNQCSNEDPAWPKNEKKTTKLVYGVVPTWILSGKYYCSHSYKNRIKNYLWLTVHF